MRQRGRSFRAVAIAMALLTNACYTYGAAGVTGDLQPESRVTARLTTRAMVDYESRVGPDVERVEGVLASSTPDSVELRVRRTLNRQGDWTAWSGERVTFGFEDLSTVRQRRLSKGRTALAIGGLIGLVGLALTTDLFGLAGGNSGTDPRPIPPVNPG